MTAIDTHRASRPGYPPMMIYQFTVGIERHTARDMAGWSHPGTSHERIVMTSSRSCAARKLARFLVAAGEPDGLIEARGADGVLRYRVNSLFAFARATLRENPSIRTIPFDQNEVSRVRSFRGEGLEAADDA